MNERADNYKRGYAHGWQWAEADLRAHTRSWEHDIRYEVGCWRESSSDLRAYYLGALRGYRACRAAVEAGEHTWAMFDAAPVGR